MKLHFLSFNQLQEAFKNLQQVHINAFITYKLTYKR